MATEPLFHAYEGRFTLVSDDIVGKEEVVGPIPTGGLSSSAFAATYA
jgi:hypothetical protein